MKLTWDNALPWWVILALVAGMGAVLVISYRKSRRPIAPKARLLFTFLRLGVLLVVILLLARPVLEEKIGGDEKAGLVFLFDASRSMTTRDEGDDER